MFGRYLVYDTHRQFNYTIVYSYINGYNESSIVVLDDRSDIHLMLMSRNMSTLLHSMAINIEYVIILFGKPLPLSYYNMYHYNTIVLSSIILILT